MGRKPGFEQSEEKLTKMREGDAILPFINKSAPHVSEGDSTGDICSEEDICSEKERIDETTQITRDITEPKILLPKNTKN